MKRVVLTFAVVASVVVSAAAQRIETETSDRTRIVHVKTELNHLTVIEVSEPVLQVAAGSPTFKVEWRENKVFVQPTEAEAATNLFIWTASQRLNYELEPAGSVATMDFAIDQTPVHLTSVKPTSVTPPAPSITDLLLQGKPVRLPPGKQRTAKRVEVRISDLYEKDGHLLIRYSVTNHGGKPYAIHTPDVYQLDGVRSPESLYGLVNSQLGDEQVAKLKIKQQTPVTVVDGKLQSQQIAPGEQAVGIVSLAIMPGAQPRVLRLEFPNLKSSDEESSGGQNTQIAAFLVR
jgi:hypothetical protein